jgi:ligand-binding SRPBCC domain-containing protein
MPTIELTTRIAAPVERVFDLARSIDLHIDSTSRSGERAVAGVMHGLIGAGQEVTWSAKHLGIRQTLTVRISAFERPIHFADTMIRGTFSSMEHHHWFEAESGDTVMRDVFTYRSPLGFLGHIFDISYLTRYLRNFLISRNQTIKQIAESDDWKKYI